MVKIQKRMKGNYIFSFQNKLMEYYGLVNEMNFIWCSGEKGPILVPQRSGSQ
jgi:hypothetical protein